MGNQETQVARLGIIGSKGRMGAALAQAIEEARHSVSGGIDQGGSPEELAAQSDCLIDFSAPVALAANLDAARGAGIPILIGTTGLEAEHFAAIAASAGAHPVLQTGNTSLGVNLLAALVETAAAKLGDDWDLEILEMHHKHKVDAP
ncbi:MAG: dihydrodipicolinate reductase C-terminal domain-containing protein, partial [Marinomonas sp.]